MRFAILAVIIFSGLAVNGQNSLHFSGNISDDTEQIVPGATLTFTAANSSVPSRSAVSQSNADTSIYTAVSDSSGGFQLNNVSPNSYSVCVQLPSGLINPCQWTWGAEPKQLNDQTASDPIVITVPTGRIVSIQFSDPNGRVSSAALLRVIVSAADGGFDEAQLISRTGTNLQYQITVPKDTPLLVNLLTQFTVTDSLGVAMTTGTPSIPIASSVNQLSFVVK